jgi:hypothetical protein
MVRATELVRPSMEGGHVENLAEGIMLAAALRGLGGRGQKVLGHGQNRR